MPDLTIHAARWCMENEYAERTIKSGGGSSTYYVTYSKSNPGPYSVNWNCGCVGFKFRKTCKHVTAAEKTRCDYGWEAAAGSPTEMGKVCPECNGPTAIMEFAA